MVLIYFRIVLRRSSIDFPKKACHSFRMFGIDSILIQPTIGENVFATLLVVIQLLR